MNSVDFKNFIKENGLIFSLNGNSNLDNSITELSTQYVLLYAQIDALLKLYFEHRNKAEITFPIDYFDFAKWLGVEVKYDDLNYFRSNRFSLLLGKLYSEDDKHTIVLDRAAPRLSQRYALCHEIAHFLCLQKNLNCIEAKLPANQEEYMSDVVASFLMLPPSLAFKKAYDYTKEYDTRPVDLNEIFLHLSSCAQIPYYRVITSYEHLKPLVYHLRRADYRKTIESIVSKKFKTSQIENKKLILDAVNEILSKGSIVAEEFFV